MSSKKSLVVGEITIFRWFSYEISIPVPVLLAGTNDMKPSCAGLVPRAQEGTD
jgi:hypothetical protein